MGSLHTSQATVILQHNNTDTQFQTRNIGIVVVIFTTYLGKLIFIPYTPATGGGFRNPHATVVSWRPLSLT